jgi:TonB family protein
MKNISLKSLTGKMNLKSALLLSFAFHIAFATLLPSMAFNRTAPLKEKSHNKVRITMLKKTVKVNSPKVEKAIFKPKSIREPQKILKVSKVLPKPIKIAKALPMEVNIPKPLTHQQPSVLNNAHRKVKAKALVPQKLPLNTTSSRSHFQRSNAEVKIAQVSPKVKKEPNIVRRVAGRSNPKKVALMKTSGARLVSHSSVLPVIRTTDKVKDSGFQTPVVAIHSNTGSQLKPTDLGLKYKTPSVPFANINQNNRSKLVTASHQSSNAVRITTLIPRQMAPVKFDEPPKETEVASEVIDQIMNDFYTKVGRQIAFAKIYPDFARKRGYQGKILVAFKINRDGKISNLSVSKSSGYKILDEAALDAVKEAGPYPPIPEELKENSLKLKIPISYVLR